MGPSRRGKCIGLAVGEEVGIECVLGANITPRVLYGWFRLGLEQEFGYGYSPVRVSIDIPMRRDVLIWYAQHNGPVVISLGKLVAKYRGKLNPEFLLEHGGRFEGYVDHLHRTALKDGKLWRIQRLDVDTSYCKCTPTPSELATYVYTAFLDHRTNQSGVRSQDGHASARAGAPPFPAA